MKKIEAVILLMFAALMVTAQNKVPNKIRVGLYANGGISSLVQGMGMNMNMYGSGYGGMYGGSSSMYNYAGSLGGGLSLTVPFHPRWSFVGNLGYMNRGANYSNYNSSYNSQYRFSYIDVWALAQYNNVPMGSVKFTASLGLTQSTLLSAQNKSDVSGGNMMNNTNKIDVGMVLGPGLEFGLKNRGAIQTRLLFTYGFMNVFHGAYYDNGMHSNNTAFLIQVGYLFN